MIRLPKHLCILLALLLVLSFALFGCGNPNASGSGETTPPTEPDPISDRYLRIQLTADPESKSDWYSRFASDELGGNFTEDLCYVDVTDVTIEINGQRYPLEEALRDGKLSEQDIFYYARKDAAAGICQQLSESVNGLTNYTFLYPEYDLRLIYDVLETPTGPHRLISHMALHPTGTNRSPYYQFIDEKTHTRYNVEDWGLAFEVDSASPSGITIRTTQSGGQQIGQLYVLSYCLVNNEGFLDRIDDKQHDSPLLNDSHPITMDGTGELFIDWTEFYGELPSGEYSIYLYVEDVFDESDVHPLMRDFMDYWEYDIDFTIP